MNNHLDKAIKKYMRAARRLLICPKGYRSRFARDMKKDLEQFIQENGSVGYPDILRYFGTPDELAQTYLDNVPQDELAEYRIKRRFHITVLSIVLAALFIAITVFLYYEFNENEVIYIDQSIKILDESME